MPPLRIDLLAKCLPLGICKAWIVLCSLSSAKFVSSEALWEGICNSQFSSRKEKKGRQFPKAIVFLKILLCKSKCYVSKFIRHIGGLVSLDDCMEIVRGISLLKTVVLDIYFCSAPLPSALPLRGSCYQGRGLSESQRESFR